MKTLTDRRPASDYIVRDLNCPKCAAPLQRIGERLFCRCNDHDLRATEEVTGRIGVVRDLARIDPDAPDILKRSGVEEHDTRTFTEILTIERRFKRFLWYGAAVLLGLVIAGAAMWWNELGAWFTEVFRP